MSDKTFEIIQKDQATRTDVYCNGLYHVTIVHPQNIHSGIPANVSLDACNCKEKQTTPSDQLPASDLNIVNSEVARERFGDEVPEATGEPDLGNSAIEGVDPVPEVITTDEPPATHAEFEALGNEPK